MLCNGMCNGLLLGGVLCALCVSRSAVRLKLNHQRRVSVEVLQREKERASPGPGSRFSS